MYLKKVTGSTGTERMHHACNEIISIEGPVLMVNGYEYNVHIHCTHETSLFFMLLINDVLLQNKQMANILN